MNPQKECLFAIDQALISLENDCYDVHKWLELVYFWLRRV